MKPAALPEEDSGEFQPLEDQAEWEQRRATVSAEVHGWRLDKALAHLVPEFSRSYLQQLLEQGAITLNGALNVKAAHKVGIGDVLLVQMRPTEQSQAFRPETMALDIVYEDAHILVVNKPVGLVVHPAAGHWSGTLLNGLLGRDAVAAQLPRAGIVHRLDKNTSGLMVVARTRMAMDALTRAIAAREVGRKYLALAWGRWEPGAMRCIEAAIGRDPRNRLRMAVVDLALHAGKSARTDVQALASDGRTTLLRCTLHTGRTHQIRVHLAFIGHPLVSDGLYGGASAGGLERQALHAYSLALVHPATGEGMAWQSPLPQDMSDALDHWGMHYNET